MKRMEQGVYRFFCFALFKQRKSVGWNKRSGSTNRLIKNNTSPLYSLRLTKKSKPCNKKPDCLKQEKKALMQQRAPANCTLRWTSIIDRTLNMSLSRLVEPLRLFHPTRLQRNLLLYWSACPRVYTSGFQLKKCRNDGVFDKKC